MSKPSKPSEQDHEPQSVSRSELAQRIAWALNMDATLCETVLTRFEEETALCLEKGQPVTLEGFGMFAIRAIPAWKLRPPAQEKAANLPAKNVPFFRSDETLRRRVNDGFDWHREERKSKIN
ncbi:MAG: HU family DNA-binding protein [Magnetococcales bacterium]|nr:HU family DNA-binding protein [Magnetococcales bacterium]